MIIIVVRIHVVDTDVTVIVDTLRMSCTHETTYNNRSTINCAQKHALQAEKKKCLDVVLR